MNTKIIITAFICLFFFRMKAQVNIKDNIIGSSISIESKILNDERELQIFLPDNYENSKKNYPVLYILDGQRYFLHAVSLQKSFVEFKQTPDFIIVGISKKRSDRNQNYNVDSQSYRDFIEKEVIKYVNITYRTSKKQMLFGWALGGGFVLETLISKPNLFDVYIAASPFPLKDKMSAIDSLLKANPSFNKLVYFTSGSNEGLVKGETRKLKTLITNKAPYSMNWVFKELKNEEHRSTPFTTLYHGIQRYYHYYPELQFNNLEEFSNFGGLEYVYDYYQKRASQFGFSNDLSDWTMFSITRNAIRADDFVQFESFINEFEKTQFIGRIRVNRACLIAEFYLKNKNYDKSLELFTLLAEKHPNNPRPLNGLGDTYTALKKFTKASKYYKKAKDI
ncbi:alpha/beta hydrolase-fold protein [Winogradskyella flava]|uniref:alpha/beta hydrolase-fold protein n=1 Tax=Winogradskyella flava TaxID=1884876 RepID=UPI002490DAF3|nr:alpha/beta hydrolase-fold protein [Winogradskyella flava]